MISYRFNAGTTISCATKVAPVDRRETHLKLLDWLIEVAAKNERCPYRSEICDRFGLLRDSGADVLLEKLEWKGFIGIYHVKNHRVVAITETGTHTRAPKTPAWAKWLRDWRRAVALTSAR